MIIEFIGGLISGSLAIMTDSAHMLSDVVGFSVSLASVWLAKKPATKKLTYGYHRAEPIGAMLSIILIWGLIAWLFVEAIYRVLNPHPIDAPIMLMTATLGLIFNIISAVVLDGWAEGDDGDEEAGQKEEEENVNVKAAAIHIIGDMIQSAGVILASLVIYFKPQYVIADPMCTFVFTFLVIATTISITKECSRVLMEGCPEDISVEDIEGDLKNLNGVCEIHDIHVWSLSVGKVAMTAHIDVDSESPYEVLSEASKMMRDKYSINHCTLQVEPYKKSTYPIDCTSELHE